MTNWIRLYDLFVVRISQLLIALLSLTTLLQLICFRVLRSSPSFLSVCAREIKKKRKLFKDYPFIFSKPLFVSVRVAIFLFDVMVVQESWPGSLSLFDSVVGFQRCLTHRLGSTHPYAITVVMEPFSTSVFKFFNNKTNLWRFVFPSHLNVCYYHQDLYWSRFHARSLLHSSIMITSFYGWSPPFLSSQKVKRELLLPTASPSPWFQRPPFSGPIHSVGELLHTP